jgi:hypothetical protein
MRLLATFWSILFALSLTSIATAQDQGEKEKVSPVVGSWTIEATMIDGKDWAEVKEVKLETYLKKGAIWKYRRDGTGNINELGNTKWSYDSDTKELIIENERASPGSIGPNGPTTYYGKYCTADVTWLDENSFKKMKMNFKFRDGIYKKEHECELSFKKN